MKSAFNNNVMFQLNLSEIEILVKIIVGVIGLPPALVVLYRLTKNPGIDLWEEVFFQIQKIKRKCFPKSALIEITNAVIGGVCEVKGNNCISINGEKPVTPIRAVDGRQINVCTPCFDENIKAKKWVIKET